MKKLSALVCAFALVAVLAGCTCGATACHQPTYKGEG